MPLVAITKTPKTKSPKIFTMVVVSNDPNSPKGTDWEHKFRTRTWGYYHNRRMAEKAILGNWTDMSENGYYQYAVVCSVPEGPCAFGKELQWYEFVWDYTKEKEDLVRRGSWGCQTDDCPEWNNRTCQDLVPCIAGHKTSYQAPELVEVKKIDKPPMYNQMLFASLG